MCSLECSSLQIFSVFDEFSEDRDVFKLFNIYGEDMLALMVGQLGKLSISLLQFAMLAFGRAQVAIVRV